MWNAISQIGQSGIQFLSTIILARLLSPDDFGIIGMVTIFISLGTMMVDSEMGGALLRKKDVNNTDYSTLFYYNLAVSIILYLLLFVCAPLIATIYGKPLLTEVIRILGLAIIIHSFRVVQQIIIFRELDFKSFALISIVSGILSLGLAIWLAYHGYGYWALVWQVIASAMINVILMGLHNRFLPLLSFSKSSFREQFNFGISLLGSDTLKVISNNISLNIIAKFAPLNITGNYTQYNRIISFSQNFMGALMNQSIFPILAKISDKNALYLQYRRLWKLIIFSMSFVTILFVLFSKIIITLILGKEWLTNIWMFQILCLVILPFGIQMLSRNILKAAGDTKLIFKIETIKSLVIIGLLLLSIFGGIYTIIWSVALGQTLVTAYYTYKTNGYFKQPITLDLVIYGLLSISLYAIVITFTNLI